MDSSEARPFVQRGNPSEVQRFVQRGVLFLLTGLAIYLGVYWWAEHLVYTYAHSNRFYKVRAAEAARYDYVILGASHAAVFDYRDLNTRLERLTDRRIMNLSVVGGGLAVNQLLLDYFLTRHHADAVVYMVDSFAFYSAAWNEERLQDTRLYVRAPFDPALAWLLLKSPATLSVALDYVSGFSKINNPDRFVPDVPAEQGSRFDRAYRPVEQLDKARLSYLYPPQIDNAVFERYMRDFEALIRESQNRGVRFIVVKTPLPERVYRRLPHEARFDEALEAMTDRLDVEHYDFSRVCNDEKLFYDTDHLNLTGAITFFETLLGPTLKSGGPLQDADSSCSLTPNMPP